MSIISLAALIAGLMNFNGNAQAYVDFLTGSIATHDPCIIKSGDTYHVFYTGNLISHVTSTNRINWTNAGSAIPDPGWFKTYVPANSGTDVWAPDISYRSGKYWLYYAVSTFGSNTSAIGCATSTSLSPAQWTDHGMVINSTGGNNYNCIDPQAFRDDDGEAWLAFGSFWSGIKLVQLDTLTGKPATGTPTIYSIAARTGGTSAIEAPFLFKRGVYYYLFASWDVCCKGANSTYNIRFGRATAITGPYKDTTGVAMSSGGGTLLWSGDTRWKGPGAENVFVDNDTTFLVFHAYDADAGGAVTLMIRPLYWTTSDWPTLAPTGIVNPTGVKAGNCRAVAFRRKENGIYTIAGPRFAVPEGSRGNHALYTVYDFRGRVLFHAPVENNKVNVDPQGRNSNKIFIARFFNF